MPELTTDTLTLFLIFAAVFALNLMPAFAPPTWMTLSFIGVAAPGIDVAPLALVGASAATLGRVTLAKLSRAIVRQKFLSQATRQNIDAVRESIQRRRGLTFTAFCTYSFSPLPSNYLFIAYGLTALPIAFVALPFFIGRLLSYAFWITTASILGDQLDLEPLESASYLGAYFIASQLLLIPALYAFTHIDWRAAVAERRFSWLKREL